MKSKEIQLRNFIFDMFVKILINKLKIKNMKKQNQSQKIKLSLNKETISLLNNLGMAKVIGGGTQGTGGQQSGSQATTISNVSFTHTSPEASANCV
jgi:hypothetical protein